MRGIRLLQKHGVEWNALAVVNDYNADYPLEFYRFFKEVGSKYIQFTPVVERLMKRSDGLTLAPGLLEGGEVFVQSRHGLHESRARCPASAIEHHTFS